MLSIYNLYFLIAMAFWQNLELQQNEFIIPIAGNTYQTPSEKPIKITASGWESWSETNTVWSTYVHSSASSQVDLEIYIPSQTANATISVDLNGSKKLQLQAGQSGWVNLGDFQLHHGYNQILFQGVEKAELISA